MKCFVMICSNATERECLAKGLFFEAEYQARHICRIEPGDRGFLYNFQSGVLHGVFRAVSAGRLNRKLDSSNWRSRYPAEVKVAHLGTLTSLTRGLQVLTEVGIIAPGKQTPSIPVHGPDTLDRLLDRFQPEETAAIIQEQLPPPGAARGRQIASAAPPPPASRIPAFLASSRLDDSQKAFCADPEPALRLLAPAGSGKTWSLLWRCLTVLRLAQAAGQDPLPRFLLVTFTRGARDELRDRLRAEPVFAPLRGQIEVSTLNGWGYARVRARHPGMRLLTSTQELVACMTETLRPVWRRHRALDAVMSDRRRRTRAARRLIEMLDAMKGLGFRHDLHDTPERFREHAEWLRRSGMEPHVDAMLKTLGEFEMIDWARTDPDPLGQAWTSWFLFWREAVEFLFEVGVLTLEDQKYWMLARLESAIERGVVTTGVHRYDSVLVDEFQDVNPLDLNLLRLIARVNGSRLTLVGDDDQAIYEWRGASPEFILDPETHAGPGYRTHILRTNYRSPRNVVELSRKLIRHNSRRVPKEVEPALTTDARIDVVPVRDLGAAVPYVLDLVRSLLADPEIRNVAILGRKRSQIIPYQIVFAGEKIPFYAAEDLHVLLSEAFEELKRILILKAQSAAPQPPPGFDPAEELLTLCDRVLRFPLGRDDRARLRNHVLSCSPDTLSDAVEALDRFSGALRVAPEGSFLAQGLAVAVRELLAASTVAEAIRVLSSRFEGLHKDHGKAVDDIFYVDPPFLFLADYAARYGTDFDAFLTDVQRAIATLALVPAEGADETSGAGNGSAGPRGGSGGAGREAASSSEEARRRPLHLMTALRAKGKEFDAVILLDCNQGIWPSRLAKTDDEREAERRLFYVAFTRVRKRVVLLVNSEILGQKAAPTQYLKEMGLE